MGSRTSSSGPRAANQGAGASYVVFGRNTAQTGPFPAGLGLSSLDGTNGFRLDGVAAAGDDHSGLRGERCGGCQRRWDRGPPHRGHRRRPNGSSSGASYVVFGRNTAQNPFPASLDLSDLDGTNGFRLDGVAADDRSGLAVSSAGDVNGDGLADLLIGASGAGPNGSFSGASYVVFGRNTAQTPSRRASISRSSMARTAFAWTASRPMTTRAPR